MEGPAKGHFLPELSPGTPHPPDAEGQLPPPSFRCKVPWGTVRPVEDVEGFAVRASRGLKHVGLTLAGLALLSAVSAPAALSFEVRGGDLVTISGFVDDDVYAAGDAVVVEGTIRGDAFLAGRSVTVNGTVEGSLFAGAQTLVVNGTVGQGLFGAAQAIVINGAVRQTARVAGQVVLIDGEGRIGRDLLAAGQSVAASEGSRIARDAGVGASQVLLAGSIGRNLKAGSGAIGIEGSVGGDAELDLGEGDRGSEFIPMVPPVVGAPSVPPGLTMGRNARIGGSLTYTASEPYALQGQVAGPVLYVERAAIEEAQPAHARSSLGDYLRLVAALLLSGVLLLSLAPNWTDDLARRIEIRPGRSLAVGGLTGLAVLGLGLGIALAAVLIALILGVTTLGGLAALVALVGITAEAVLTIGTIAFCSLIAQALAAYVLGRWILDRIGPTWRESPYRPMILGVLVFAAFRFIPVVGWLLEIGAAVVGLGALYAWGRNVLGPRTDVPAPARSSVGEASGA